MPQQRKGEQESLPYTKYDSSHNPSMTWNAQEAKFFLLTKWQQNKIKVSLPEKHPHIFQLIFI